MTLVENDGGTSKELFKLRSSENEQSPKMNERKWKCGDLVWFLYLLPEVL